MYSVDVQKSSYKSGQSRINDGSRFVSWSPWVRCLRLQSRVVHDIQFVEISSAYEQVNNIQRCIVAVKGATDAQLSILDDLIQSKRKQVGQYHELAEIPQEALDMMQLDYEFVYPKKRIYLK